MLMVVGVAVTGVGLLLTFMIGVILPIAGAIGWLRSRSAGGEKDTDRIFDRLDSFERKLSEDVSSIKTTMATKADRNEIVGEKIFNEAIGHMQNNFENCRTTVSGSVSALDLRCTQQEKSAAELASTFSSMKTWFSGEINRICAELKDYKEQLREYKKNQEEGHKEWATRWTRLDIFLDSLENRFEQERRTVRNVLKRNKLNGDKEQENY
jgi:hypothetical protein